MGGREGSLELVGREGSFLDDSVGPEPENFIVFGSGPDDSLEGHDIAGGKLAGVPAAGGVEGEGDRRRPTGW